MYPVEPILEHNTPQQIAAFVLLYSLCGGKTGKFKHAWLVSPPNNRTSAIQNTINYESKIALGLWQLSLCMQMSSAVFAFVFWLCSFYLKVGLL